MRAQFAAVALAACAACTLAFAPPSAGQASVLNLLPMFNITRANAWCSTKYPDSVAVGVPLRMSQAETPPKAVCAANKMANRTCAGQAYGSVKLDGVFTACKLALILIIILKTKKERKKERKKKKEERRRRKKEKKKKYYEEEEEEEAWKERSKEASHWWVRGGTLFDSTCSKEKVCVAGYCFNIIRRA